MRRRVRPKRRITPTTANAYPSASSAGASIGTRKGDQVVRRKVYVSKRRDKPAITSAYPTHLLGGIAILDLDSTLDGQVPQDAQQEHEKSGGSFLINLYPRAPISGQNVQSAGFAICLL